MDFNTRTFTLLGAATFGSVLALAAALGSFYSVNQSERAFVRTFGTVTTQTPIEPGLHMKLPFISTVDKLLVSQQTLKIDTFGVNTIDNQQVQLTIDIQYKVPIAGVYRLLYQVGRTGSADIDESISAIVKDRVSRIFSSKNTNTISENREIIQEKTQAFVGSAVKENFGIELVSLQIAEIKFSDTFVQSNSVAVLAKNQAIQEENRLRVVGYKAQQSVIEAQGQRDQQVAAAEGRNKSAILNAEAEAKATELHAAAAANAKVMISTADAKALLVQAEAEKQAAILRGTGDAAARKAIIDATGGSEKYIELTKAEAQKNWNGAYPQIVGGGQDKGGFMMPLILGSQTLAAPK